MYDKSQLQTYQSFLSVILQELEPSATFPKVSMSRSFSQLQI